MRKAEGGLAAAAVRHGAGACGWGGGGAGAGADKTMCCTCRPRRLSCTLHSAPMQRHVALNMGVKETSLTERKGLLDKHPVAHLLDPKRRRAENGEGSQGSKRSRK